ncbi:MAG: hypothetical protein N2505_00040 [Endomicrobia bacterium]|nr:hypothetical protein [Endomicrobiia bacterium]
MTNGHFLEKFLKKKGFDEKIIQHIKPYNVEKQIKKLKKFSKHEIGYINEILLKIHNKQYIFPLFYSLICKINIESIADYIYLLSDKKPHKNKNIYHCNHETMENAMKLLTREFNTDSIILIIELIDKKLCDMISLQNDKDKFKIDEINETTFQVVERIASLKKKYVSFSSLVIKELEKRIDKPYFNLLIDIQADVNMIQDIEKLYSLNSLTNEKICILNTDIEEVIRRDRNTNIIRHIINKFETIKQISWKRFVWVFFTYFNESELNLIMKYLTVENFHNLFNYDGRFCRVLLYLIANDDKIADQLKKYINDNSIDSENDLNNTEEIIREAIKLYKSYKQIHPIKFLFDSDIPIHRKRILIGLASDKDLIHLVLDEDFLAYLKVTEIQNINEIKDNIIKGIDILYSLKKLGNTEDIAFLLLLIEHKVCEDINDFSDALRLKEKIVEKGYKNIYFKTCSYIDQYAKAIKIVAKYMNEPCLDLLLDCYFEGKIYKIFEIDKFYSLNSVSNEPICIIGTSIERIVRKKDIIDFLKYIYDKFDIIQQIGWKSFASVDFTKFDASELKFIMQNLTVKNFHHLLNYDGNFNKLLFYLITNDDNLANQAIKYLPSLIENIIYSKSYLFMYQLEKTMLNFVKLYKNSKPFDFMLKPYCFETKNILTELILREYPDELVTDENFIKYIDNVNSNIHCPSPDDKNYLIMSYIKEGIYNNFNIFLLFVYGNTYKEITRIKNILEKKYKIHNHIKRIKELIKKYLTLEKDEKVKKELLIYLTTAKTRKRKIILYSIVIDLMKSINKKSKSLFYLAFEKNVGYSLIETKMINEFKQFLSL